VVSTGRIDLSWNDNSSNETQFKLQRKPQGGVWSTVAWPGQNQTQYIDNSVSAGTWCYRIRSHNADGFSLYVESTPTCVDNSGGSPPPPPPPSGIPAAPSNVQATVVTSSRIDVSWTDNASNESSFKLQRKPQGGVWTTVSWLPANTTTYADTGLPAGSWCYRIRSHNADGFSLYVGSGCVTVGGGGGGSTVAVPAPSNFTAISPSADRIILQWQDNTTNEHSFKLQWTLAGTEDWTTIWVFQNETSFSHAGLPDGNYCYRIRAHTDTGFSNYVLSEPQCIRTGSGGSSTVNGPLAPTGFAATPAAGRVNLTWNDVATTELGYKMQWQEPGGAWSTIWIYADEESFLHVVPSAGSYCYRIRSYDAALNNSNYVLSEPVCVAVGS
jgi:titin